MAGVFACLLEVADERGTTGLEDADDLIQGGQARRLVVDVVQAKV